MSRIDKILEYNKHFVESGKHKSYTTTKFPDKKIAVLSCMDTRLTELLPAALSFRNGDIKIIKNAGALVSHPFGSVMRSILIAIYELGVEEIMVIGHHDCGMQQLNHEALIAKMRQRGISADKIDMVRYAGIDLPRWLKGFDCAEASVSETVGLIKKHPFIPSDVEVHGFLIDPETGGLKRLT